MDLQFALSLGQALNRTARDKYLDANSLHATVWHVYEDDADSEYLYTLAVYDSNEIHHALFGVRPNGQLVTLWY